MTDLSSLERFVIQFSFKSVRAHVSVLVQRWRHRRIGTQVWHLFEELDAALERSPHGSQEVVDATFALGALLEKRAPTASTLVDPVLDALYAFHKSVVREPLSLIAGSTGTHGGAHAMTAEEAAEIQAAMDAERAWQAAGNPPSDANGGECRICAVIERQKQRRAS